MEPAQASLLSCSVQDVLSALNVLSGYASALTDEAAARSAYMQLLEQVRSACRAAAEQHSVQAPWPE